MRSRPLLSIGSHTSKLFHLYHSSQFSGSIFTCFHRMILPVPFYVLIETAVRDPACSAWPIYTDAYGSSRSFFNVFKRRFYSVCIFFVLRNPYTVHTLAFVFEGNMTFKQQFW